MNLFRDAELQNILAATHKKIKESVDKYTNDEILANDFSILTDNLYEEYYIEPVTIHEEDLSQRKVTQGQFQKRVDPFFRNVYGKEYVTVDGMTMTFYFPFDGDKELFKCKASTFSLSSYPEISLCNGYFSISYQKTLQEMEADGARDLLLKEVERDIESIKDGVAYCNNDVASFNSSLRGTILQLLQDKKKKVEAFYSVAAMFEVPVSKTIYAETHIPMKRSISPISHTYDEQPSYCISDKDYGDILSTIKHTACTYERTPISYKSMHEEDLRNTLLAALNATYKGDAMGEAFRNKGKTDICIERENRAAFVAECKMWTGQKELPDAVKQLDSYLTWRDCKTALIYFVRRKDFLSVVTTTETALKAIPAMRQVIKKDANEFKCSFASQSNPGQLVQIRVMLFNLFA